MDNCSPFSAVRKIGAVFSLCVSSFLRVGMDVEVGWGEWAPVAVGIRAVVPSGTGAPSDGRDLDAAAASCGGPMEDEGAFRVLPPIRPEGVMCNDPGVGGATNLDGTVCGVEGEGGSSRANCRMRDRRPLWTLVVSSSEGGGQSVEGLCTERP